MGLVPVVPRLDPQEYGGGCGLDPFAGHTAGFEGTNTAPVLQVSYFIPRIAT